MTEPLAWGLAAAALFALIVAGIALVDRGERQRKQIVDEELDPHPEGNDQP